MEKPPIRILQRPCPIQSNQSKESIRPPTAVKTLEQREADYAAARRRIMGSESPEPEIEINPVKGTNKHTANGNSQNENSTPRHSSATSVTTSATPLMSIQATPVVTAGTLSDFRLSNTSLSGTTVQPAHNIRQGLAVVNVAQKLQQQQPQATNGPRQMLPQQQQQRILTASASSPSFFSHSSRTSQPLPLFPSQVGNANVGLLPTPPGFNYSAQNASLNTGGLHHSQSAALALMHQFSLLQQQYHQTLNGFQNQLISPIVSNVSHNSLNHLNFSPAVNSQTGVNQKHAHPPTFN